MAASWVPGSEGSGFDIDHLPYGVFGPSRHIGVAIGDYILDVTAAAEGGLVDDPDDQLAGPTLDRFMAVGPDRWREVREQITGLLAGDTRTDGVMLVERSDATLHLPWMVRDYVDFYSSEQHATNLGRMFRPDSEPLLPNWRHVPVGYHGRSGTVIVTGTDVTRPHGQKRPETPDAQPKFGPSERLDIEAEVGFVVGKASETGGPVAASALSQHVFGLCLVNDWSARDIQAWEYVPLGPFLGKSFATSVAAWITPLEALQAARVTPPSQDPEPLPHLHDDDPWALDLRIEVRLNGTLISTPPFAGTYWTPGQQLAHMTSNGAHVGTGDLYASGTVSGDQPDEVGSLIELTWNGRDPIQLEDGTTRTFLEDGDEVVISATCPSVSGGHLTLGSVTGRIVG